MVVDRRKAAGICDKLIIFGIFVFIGASTSSITVTQAGYILALMAWVAKMVVDKKLHVHRTPLDLPLLAYLVAEVIALIFSIDRMDAIMRLLKRFWLIPIIYLVASNVGDERTVKRLLTALIMTAATVFCWGLVDYFEGSGLNSRFSPFHHWQTTGGLTMIVATFAICILLWGISGAKRALLGVAAIVIIASLLFTFTRGSWLGLIAAVFTAGVYKDKKLIAALLAAILVIYAFVPTPLKERAKSIFYPYHPSNVERLYMWRSGLEMIKDRPITGVGDIDLGDIYSKYMLPEAKETHGHLHSNFIHFGVTLGLLGLGTILWLFIKIFLMELSIYKNTPLNHRYLKSVVLACIAIFVGFNVNGLFEWNFGDSEIIMLIWFTVGLSLAIKNMVEGRVIKACKIKG